jgi:hypothetical protein
MHIATLTNLATGNGNSIPHYVRLTLISYHESNARSDFILQKFQINKTRRQWYLNYILHLFRTAMC